MYADPFICQYVGLTDVAMRSRHASIGTVSGLNRDSRTCNTAGSVIVASKAFVSPKTALRTVMMFFKNILRE